MQSKQHNFHRQTKPTMTSISDKNLRRARKPSPINDYSYPSPVDYDRLYREGKLDEWVAKQLAILRQLKSEVRM
jgi:hypothetical protein